MAQHGCIATSWSSNDSRSVNRARARAASPPSAASLGTCPRNTPRQHTHARTRSKTLTYHTAKRPSTTQRPHARHHAEAQVGNAPLDVAERGGEAEEGGGGVEEHALPDLAARHAHRVHLVEDNVPDLLDPVRVGRV
eukprot:47643-Rhodomonas_salina.2